jgi:3-oxoacyl-[acyl-carrier protein] reductase
MKEGITMFDFTGKYAVITGARQGIGAGIAKRFFADGAAGIAVLDVTDDAAWAKELDPNGERILCIACDITDRAAVGAAFDKIYEKFGRIDFLVNNAGIIKDGMFHKMSDAAWDSVIDVDLNGVFNCTRKVINGMREQGFGRIVNMSSVSVYGHAGQTNYSSAKGALLSFTKTLAKESTRKGITVNAILPAAIETEMTSGFAKDPDGPKMGQPEDVASLVAYLCTEEAWFVNGAAIDFNGAYH